MGRSMLRLALPILFVAVGAGLSGASSSVIQGRVEGVWEAQTYLLADGTLHPVRGRIFFQGRHWQVLFFVVDASSSRPHRGSAEGGTYTLAGDQLTFRHELNLSVGDAIPGLPEAPLRMIARHPEQAVPETARVTVEGDALTLLFPSGNRLHFERATMPSGQL